MKFLKNLGLCCLLACLLSVAVFAADTVYVKDGGTGSGLSADSAFGDLADAFRALPDGGKIIVCGDYSMANSTSYDASVPAFIAPATNGTTTITSENGGKLVCPAGGRYFCTQNTVFENITFYQNPRKTFVVAGRFFDLTFGEGVVIDDIEFHVVGGMEHTNAVVGVPDEDYSKDAHVTALSGNFEEITGLGRNVGKSGGKADYTGKAYITFGGTATVGGIYGAYRWGSPTRLGGNVDITITGGTIRKCVVACSERNEPHNVQSVIRITDGFDPTKSFTTVTPGFGSGDNPTFYGFNGAGLNQNSSNFGKSVLDIAGNKKLNETWIKTYVNVDSFDEITGFKANTSTDMSVVFVADSGDAANDGKSYETAVLTLAQAFKKLGTEGGTVVVAGPTTLDSAASTFPTLKGTVRFTSVYDGTDYRKSPRAKLNITSNFFLGSDVVFEDIVIAGTGNRTMFGLGHNITMGEGVEMSFPAGNGFSIWGGTQCSRTGTTVNSTRFFDYTIEINSGTYRYIRGGSLRDGETQAVGTVGNVTIIFNDGEITSTTTDKSKNEILAIAGFDALDGDATIIINGGKIGCSIMGIGRPGTNSTASNAAFARGNINITINGGTFGARTTIGAIHDTVASELDGDFTLTVTGGEFPENFRGFDASSVWGTKTANIVDGIDFPLTGFDKAVYVSDKGNDASDGLSATTAKKTVSAAVKEIGAEGGTVVVCGKAAVDTEALSDYEYTVTFTSFWHNIDYRKSGAALTVNGTLTLGGRTVFSDIDFAGNGTVDANGYDLTVNGTVAGGNLRLTGGKGTATHGITVNGGSFASVDGGSVSVTDASTYVIVNGGKIGDVYGAAGGTAGTGSVSLRGGEVTGILSGAKNGSGKDAGVEIRGGKYAAANAKNASVKGEAFTTDYASFTDAKVLFVKDGGTGDGSTPDKAMSDIVAATEKLTNGGTIVVCGPLRLTDGKSLRAMKGRMTLTSLYRGIDYAATEGANIELRKYITFASDATIENIKLVPAANDTYISAEGHDLLIGEGITCEIFKGNRTEDHIDLVVGSFAQSPSLKQDLSMTVKSGTWGSLSGGQFSTAANPGLSRKLEGNITLNVYGGTFTDDCFVAGVNNLVGNATLNAYGGRFACPVFGIDGEKITVTGNVTINALGASFEGDIRAAQNNDPTLNGAYTLNIYGGNLTRTAEIVGADALKGNHTSAIHTADGIDLAAKISGNITYQNPVAGYADPSVVFAGGWYYYTYCASYGGKDSLYMAKAANICDIGKVEPKLIWSQATTGEAPEMTALWAPQLYKLKDENGVERWYIYAAAQTGTDAEFNANKRFPYVWVGGDDPEGPYKFFGCMENIDEEVFNYLSPRVIEHDGHIYMFMSGFYRAEDMNPHTQRMRVCQLETPTKMASKQIVISSPCYEYEYSHSTVGAGIMEGPFPFYGPTGTLYLIFAAGHTRTDEYATGLMRFNGGPNDPLIYPELWEKFEEPFQFTNYANRVYSPGAMVVTTSPDGQHYYGAYHAKEYHYSAYTMRRLHIQEITFDASGFPHIEDAQPVSTVFTIPINSMPLADRISGFGGKVGTLGKFDGKFKPSRTYTGAFADVTDDKWFAPYVKTAYEYGLANGTSATTFSPDSKFTVAQALTAAANIHTAYTGKTVRAAAAGEAWYVPYVEYCIENGIIVDGQFTNFDQNITRGDMAIVFANILPESEYTSVRDGSNPDVTKEMSCYAAVKKLYEAGIVGGDAGTGNYRPNDEIVRSEACVIFTRIAAAEYRAK